MTGGLPMRGEGGRHGPRRGRTAALVCGAIAIGAAALVGVEDGVVAGVGALVILGISATGASRSDPAIALLTLGRWMRPLGLLFAAGGSLCVLWLATGLYDGLLTVVALGSALLAGAAASAILARDPLRDGGLADSVPLADVGSEWLAERIASHGAGPTKRILDIAIALPLLVVAAPLVAILAVAIRCDGGPALFQQQRVGRDGRPFPMIKLRTMNISTVDDGMWCSDDDPRVTRIGALLRRTHLDELPQLINVLRGEMTLVGPRPEQPAFVEWFSEHIPNYELRHAMKPGVTGWAQVRCGYGGSVQGTRDKVAHDLFYLVHRSTALDLAILCETVRKVAKDCWAARQPAVSTASLADDHELVVVAPAEPTGQLSPLPSTIHASTAVGSSQFAMPNRNPAPHA